MDGWKNGWMDIWMGGWFLRCVSSHSCKSETFITRTNRRESAYAVAKRQFCQVGAVVVRTIYINIFISARKVSVRAILVMCCDFS